MPETRLKKAREGYEDYVYEPPRMVVWPDGGRTYMSGGGSHHGSRVSVVVPARVRDLAALDIHAGEQ